MALTEAFRLRMSWDGSENYRVLGEYNPSIRVVMFDLLKAIIVGKDRVT